MQNIYQMVWNANKFQSANKSYVRGIWSEILWIKTTGKINSYYIV